MGIGAELKALEARAEGDPAELEPAVRRATSIRDVLAGARAAAGHPDVRAALEDGLAQAENTLQALESLSRRAGPTGEPAGPAAPGADASAGAPGAGGPRRPAWPPSGEMIDQAAEGLEKLAAGVTSVLGQLARELSRAADDFGRTPARCRKCGTALGEARFCPRCGTARG